MISKSALTVMWHVGVLVVVACVGPVAARENVDRQRINGAEWHMSDKSAEGTNGQWFADLERGWIRVKPRQQPKKKAPAQPPQNRNEDPKTKASPASLDY